MTIGLQIKHVFMIEASRRLDCTNQADEGVESKAATGPMTFERTFTADFAKDQPWRHYPAVTALTDAGKQQLAKLVADRVGWFAPPYDAIHKALDAQ